MQLLALLLLLVLAFLATRASAESVAKVYYGCTLGTTTGGTAAVQVSILGSNGCIVGPASSSKFECSTGKISSYATSDCSGTVTSTTATDYRLCNDGGGLPIRYECGDEANLIRETKYTTATCEGTGFTSSAYLVGTCGATISVDTEKVEIVANATTKDRAMHLSMYPQANCGGAGSVMQDVLLDRCFPKGNGLYFKLSGASVPSVAFAVLVASLAAAWSVASA